MARLFKGGIHPPGKKESTRKKPLLPLDTPPKRIVLPLTSPSGYDLQAIVSQGDVVKMGQKVAEPLTPEGVPLFSGISGLVVDVDHEPNPLCGWAPSIVIENDMEYQLTEYESYPDPASLSQEQLISLIAERGVRGMSHDDTPVSVKIMEGRGKIDTLIINASECEPYLTADYRLLLERQDLVVGGSKLLAYAMGAEEVVVAIQGDKLDAIEDLEKTIGWDKETMGLRTLPTCFPFGEEKQVVRFVKGVEIPSGQPVHWAHCAIFNIATAYAVGEAIIKGLPQTHRAVTVSGGAVHRPRNLWVPIGTPFSCLVENAGDFRENPGVLLAGGPMTGLPQQDIRVPVLVNTPGLLALSPFEVPKHLAAKTAPTMPCIRCGHCMTVCPMHLSPNQVYRLMERPKLAQLSAYHPEDCIHCGCCNYRCPANLPLAETMDQAQKLFGQRAPVEEETDVKIYARHLVKEKKPKKSKMPKALKPHRSKGQKGERTLEESPSHPSKQKLHLVLDEETGEISLDLGVLKPAPLADVVEVEVLEEISPPSPPTEDQVFLFEELSPQEDVASVSDSHQKTTSPPKNKGKHSKKGGNP